METGIELIAKERQEQIDKHGRTLAKDVSENSHGELKKGAEAILSGNQLLFPYKWDEHICQKMFNKPYKERLIIVGALIAAEIDRLQYKE